MNRSIKTALLICTCLILMCGCKNASENEKQNEQGSNLDIAEAFVDAFYSFNGGTLSSLLTQAQETQSSILYYQTWAECGNYKVVKRNAFIEKNDSLVLCPITVKDDLIGALGLALNVTDTFHLTIVNDKIRSVETSSNDPDLFYKAIDWIKQNRPELTEKPCEGESRACDCVQATVKGFSEFMANNPTQSK